MKITVNLETGKLTCLDKVYKITNNVRSVKEGTRATHEVVITIPGHKPYDPCQFPKGKWKITGVEWQDISKFDYATYGPVKIKTNANILVNVWELDDNKDYLKETDEQVIDSAYWLHYSNFLSTLGCIRLDSESDAIELGHIIEDKLKAGKTVKLEVL